MSLYYQTANAEVQPWFKQLTDSFQMRAKVGLKWFSRLWNDDFSSSSWVRPHAPNPGSTTNEIFYLPSGSFRVTQSRCTVEGIFNAGSSSSSSSSGADATKVMTFTLFSCLTTNSVHDSSRSSNIIKSSTVILAANGDNFAPILKHIHTHTHNPVIY